MFSYELPEGGSQSHFPSQILSKSHFSAFCFRSNPSPSIKIEKKFSSLCRVLKDDYVFHYSFWNYFCRVIGMNACYFCDNLQFSVLFSFHTIFFSLLTELRKCVTITVFIIYSRRVSHNSHFCDLYSQSQ